MKDKKIKKQIRKLKRQRTSDPDGLTRYHWFLNTA